MLRIADLGHKRAISTIQHQNKRTNQVIGMHSGVSIAVTKLISCVVHLLLDRSTIRNHSKQGIAMVITAGILFQSLRDLKTTLNRIVIFIMTHNHLSEWIQTARDGQPLKEQDGFPAITIQRPSHEDGGGGGDLRKTFVPVPKWSRASYRKTLTCTCSLVKPTTGPTHNISAIRTTNWCKFMLDLIMLFCYEEEDCCSESRCSLDLRHSQSFLLPSVTPAGFPWLCSVWSYYIYTTYRSLCLAPQSITPMFF